MRLNAQRLPVSPAGGIDPHWRADGREIIYLGLDRTLMAVSVTFNGNAVSLGKPDTGCFDFLPMPADRAPTGRRAPITPGSSSSTIRTAPHRRSAS